jgi:hypothetical protein
VTFGRWFEGDEVRRGWDWVVKAAACLFVVVRRREGTERRLVAIMMYVVGLR